MSASRSAATPRTSWRAGTRSTRSCSTIVLRMGGSISAEHGIGVLKRDELPDVKDKVAIELMRGIKAMLDPLGIMNPGKVL